MTDIKRNGSGKIYCHLCRCYERYPRQVLWNISSSMHCYETRFGGKCAAEVTLPTAANQKNNHCEEPRSCQPPQLASCEQPSGETGHHLRSRSHFWPQAGLVATTAEEKAPDSSSHPQPARTTRDAEETVSHLAAGTPARKRKRLTAEEKLIEDNKAYYKLEMKNNKLRSSGYFITSRSSFEMGHAFVKEAEVSPVNNSKQFSGVVNCSGGHKNNFDHKNIEHKNIDHKISSDCVTRDSQGDDSERCRLRSCRKPESDCSNSRDNSENSINHSDSGAIYNDKGKNSSSETKNNNLHKNSNDNKTTSRKTQDSGKETNSQCSAVNECKETEEKKDSSNKQVGCESEEQRDLKTESSGSGPSRTRIRLSELSLLSNEAENFMFGEPVKKISSDESSDDDDDDCVPLKLKIVKKSDSGDTKAKWKAKRPVGRKKGRRIYRKVHRKVKVTSKKPKKGITSRVKKRRLASVHQFDDSSLGSADGCSVGSTSDANTLSGRHRKRRTHAEAFIHDNLDYYKFEIPGSRLRFQGSVLPQMNASETQGSETDSNGNKKSSENSHTCDSNKENSLNSSDSPLVQFNIKSLEAIRKGLNDKLNAENELKNSPEAIIETGIKKEESKSSNESVTKDLSLDRLRFSFEASPQGEPWYQTYQRQDTGNEIYLSCPIDTSYWKSFLLPYEMTPSELAAAAASSNLPSCTKSIDPSESFKKKRKRFAHLLDKKPRKSPRCHASTLAILSSLMHFRKRKEPDKVKEDTPAVKDDGPSLDNDDNEQNKDEQSNTSCLGEMSTVEGAMELKKDFSELAQNIDEMLESFPENSESLISASPRNTNDNNEMKLRTHRSSRLIYKKQSKSQREKFSKRLNQMPLKESDLIDMDHSVLASLATMSKDTVGCIPKAETCSRGGPTMDVVSLISNITDCHCPGPPLISKDCVRCGVDLFCPAMREMSCNSSECGASSTCDTITYSDGPEGRQGIRGKRRKRKKNRTGWPVDKQKFRKKFYLRFKKRNENIPVQHAGNLHKHDGEDLCKPTESEVPLDVSIKAGCSGSLGIDTEVQKPPEKVEKIEVPEPLDRLEEEGVQNTCTSVGNSVSKGELISASVVPSESSQSDRKTDKDSLSESVPVTYNMRHEKHSRLLRTGSLDSGTCSELKPCVKVKRIPNLAEYQIVPTIKIGISNRRLRSASSSSLTCTPVTKMDFVDDSIKDESVNNRRSCRKKRPKFTDSWDTWLTPNRR